MNVKIVGNGVWGKALYSVIQQNSSTVNFLERDEKASDQDIIVLAVPTNAIREVLENITFKGQTKIVVNTSKGIEKHSNLLPSEIVRSRISQEIEYYTLIGPSFAREVTEKMPTIVNLGYEKESDSNEKIKELFQTDYFRVRLAKGVKHLEISAVFKNIYAIACGLAAGCGFETNTKINVIVAAIEEMENLYTNMGLSQNSEITAGTLGDLVLTCISNESRNYKFGYFLAQDSVEKSLQRVNSTVEGYDSIGSITYFESKANVKLPLASFIQRILQDNDPVHVKDKLQSFFKTL